MADIFVSYSRKDKERVRPLVEELERRNWSVWWDPKLTPGAEFDEEIREALIGATCVVVVWSANSISSRWVRGEARVALERGVLIPVQIDDVDLPIDLMAIQTANLSDWTAGSTTREFDKVIEELQHKLGDARSTPTLQSPAVANSNVGTPGRITTTSSRFRQLMFGLAAVVTIAALIGVFAMSDSSGSDTPPPEAPYWGIGVSGNTYEVLPGSATGIPDHDERLAIIANESGTDVLVGHGQIERIGSENRLSGVTLDGYWPFKLQSLRLEIWTDAFGQWPGAPERNRRPDVRPRETFAISEETFEMVSAPGGATWIGMPEKYVFDRRAYEDMRRIDVGEPFQIGKTEVTQGLWKAIMGENAVEVHMYTWRGLEQGPCVQPILGGYLESITVRPDAPVSCISWFEAIEFCNRLSEALNLSPVYQLYAENGIWRVEWDKNSDGFRLPTTLEWEHAAKAGRDTFYAGSDNRNSVAWTQENAEGRVHPVCRKWPNAWGLCDMSGNVWEWVWDDATEPVWNDEDSELVRAFGKRDGRGGGVVLTPESARVSYRDNFYSIDRYSGLGFRVARSMPKRGTSDEPR